MDSGTGYSVEYMRSKFADMVAMNITSLLARIITKNKINVLTIDTMKPEISQIQLLLDERNCLCKVNK